MALPLFCLFLLLILMSVELISLWLVWDLPLPLITAALFPLLTLIPLPELLATVSLLVFGLPLIFATMLPLRLRLLLFWIELPPQFPPDLRTGAWSVEL